MAYTRALDPVEARVLGSLMEKERTTPDLYPLTVSALLQACNQKTSRDPVSDYTETQIVEALDRLRTDALVFRVHSSRSERYEHCLDRRWRLDTRGAAALMALLLLRGAQTVAELRARTARLHTFASHEEVEATLSRLASGEDALVRELPRQPGQRETRWIHLAGDATVESEMLAGLHAAAPHEAVASRTAPAADLGELGARIEELERVVALLRDELSALRDRLGD